MRPMPLGKKEHKNKKFSCFLGKKGEMSNNPDDWLLNEKPLPPPSFSQQLRRIAETNSSSNVYASKETHGIELGEVETETEGSIYFT